MFLLEILQITFLEKKISAFFLRDTPLLFTYTSNSQHYPNVAFKSILRLRVAEQLLVSI